MQANFGAVLTRVGLGVPFLTVDGSPEVFMLLIFIHARQGVFIFPAVESAAVPLGATGLEPVTFAV